MGALRVDPVAYATMAGFTASDAKRGTADPTLYKLAESLEQLSHAVAVIAERQAIQMRTNQRVVAPSKPSVDGDPQAKKPV